MCHQKEEEKKKITFNAEGGTLRRLSDTSKHIELHLGSEGLDQADCGGAFSFTQGGGCNTADKKTKQKKTRHGTYPSAN